VLAPLRLVVDKTNIKEDTGDMTMKTIEEIRNERAADRAAFVAEYTTGDAAGYFKALRDGYWGNSWQTVGEIAELIRQSWCNKIQVNGRSMWFDILSRRDQYLIARAIVSDKTKWDHCLGSNDGREVRVYKAIAGA